MIVLAAPMESLRTGKLLRYATCWRIERLDGQVFRYTDHNARLRAVVDPTLLYGASDPYEAFEAVTGVAVSAREIQASLEPSNLEARGVISATEIKEGDLRAGLFDAAKVREITVDWMFPWLGPFRTKHWVAGPPEFTGETWRIELRDLTVKLQVPVGDVYARQGRLKETPVDTDTGEAITIITQRRVFKCQTGTLDTIDGAYDNGTVAWTSGANAGTRSTVRAFTNVGGGVPLQFELMLETPHDISSGDDFTVTEVAYDDEFPFIPGTDALRESPPPAVSF